MVFQDPEDQLFMNSVFEDVAFGPRNQHLTEQEVRQRVDDALERMGISHLKDRAPFKLSGGEKRAAAIASVLSMAPDILIMDEPTAGLDPYHRRNMMALLGTFSHTKVITSHDLDMVYEICDRVLVIKNGTVAADGHPKVILTDERLLADCRLELPPGIRDCPACGNKKPKKAIR